MAEQFNWTAPNLNQHHFISFANLLALRNGGQVEPAWSLHDSEEEERDEEDETNPDTASSVNTNQVQQISDSGYDKLKRKFLDCVAELAANDKGARFVACSAMREGEDEVTVWISRNEGFREVDHVAFARVGGLLGGLGSVDPGNRCAEELWTEMLTYYRARLESTYIPSLRSTLKDCEQLFHDDKHDEFVPARQRLQAFHQLVFDGNSPGQAVTDRHSVLIVKAYELRMMKPVRELLHTSHHSTPRTKKLWESICFLGRLRVAFETFQDIALNLPSFKKVTIILIPRDIATQKALQRPLNLDQTFNLLDVPLDPSMVKKVIGQKWTVPKAKASFGDLQKHKLNVHAEVQMVLYLSKIGQTFERLFPYFGCSKYSCFMCWHFLQAHSKIRTRGCHGRLFKPWSVPEVSGMTPGSPEKISHALIQLQRRLRKELKAEIKKGISQEKTSVVGGSSVFTTQDPSSARRKAGIERTRMRAEQARVTELFRRWSLEEEASKYQGSRLNVQPNAGNATRSHAEYRGECYTCSGDTSRRCSLCQKDFYCSQLCEDKRSGRHLFTCTKRPLTSADFLYRNIEKDRLPEEEEVCSDFGFNYFDSFADKSKLLGLYKGLWLAEIPVEDINKWQVEGSLVANIKEHFYQIPERYRGGYFPWFLEHTQCLDKPITEEEAAQRTVATFFDKARSYLDKEDQYKHYKQLEPEAKRDCFYMLAQTLHMANPDPIETNWFNFGFCTCDDEYKERSLGGLYQRLLVGDKLYDDVPTRMPRMKDVQTATFTEFWKAYELGTMIQLMDSKGLGRARFQFPFLEEFFSSPPCGPHLSVWSLKQFLAINNPAEFPPIPAISVDYGFGNCETFTETCTLMEIYRRLLGDASPLDLHGACIAGKLFEFAERFHKMDQSHRRLMKNFYPLPEL
ncbi:hypothetical protein ANOM_008385 [Aspergillus nomiae NRRL 13137]|uniref:MYND-type domain-containing protein n=1 Tax=Aspergillus nomiae NRRL (strain ATCC 15546 / NRRL 13137 / CBS 260.88 / M93) TaxID=1509407 RepID=A0A0L1IUT7_ASPN3|nr:uncharacterized protein ANOM_008385 [Aspergillus nomiae NRRL 13137]KNG83331.1 hypothetical protein ANOM_008385 [Aspergillus nomiae NRRL 13137]